MSRTFNARQFFMTHGDSGSTAIKLIAGDESYRVRLPGIPVSLTVDGIAAHAGSIPEKLKVSADKVEVANGAIIATPTKAMFGKDVAAFVRGVATIDAVEETPVKDKADKASKDKADKATKAATV